MRLSCTHVNGRDSGLGVVGVHERDRDHPRRADDLAHAIEQLLARLLHAPAVVHGADDARVLHRLDDRARLVEADRERLLAQHVQPAPRRGDRDRRMLGDRAGDVHRLEARMREQLVDVGGPEREVVLVGELAGALGAPRPHGHRLELVELGVDRQRDLRAVAAADDGDLHGVGHARQDMPAEPSGHSR